MPTSFAHRGYYTQSYLAKDRARALVDQVLDGSIDYDKIYRDNSRTLSARIRFEGQPLMLKIPRARNRRRWERLLTLLRGSDSRRSFRHLGDMAAMGFCAPQPVMFCEKREAWGVTDSFLVYRFVDGLPAASENAAMIVAALRKLHAEGYLRGDAQLANFLVAGESVVFIDFRLKRPRVFPRFQKARELHRFLRSCPQADTVIADRELASLSYRLASRWENSIFAIRRLKKRLRKGKGKRRT